MKYEDAVALCSPRGLANLEWAQSLDWSKRAIFATHQAVRERFGVLAPVVADVVAARSAAKSKLHIESGFVADKAAVEQSTPSVVARHRASRLTGRSVHDLTCSVGSELAHLGAGCSSVLGSDLDPARVYLARHNTEMPVALADALHPCSSAEVYIADPGRRADGRRITNPAQLQPPLPTLLTVLSGIPGSEFAVKCAPGLDLSALERAGVAFIGESEVVSVRGAVKEMCLWSPGLSDGVRYRATLLDADGAVREQITNHDNDHCETAPVGDFIIDPDGAIVRAGLVRHWGARHGLWQLDHRIAYLSGPAVPNGCTGFPVQEQLRFDERTLRLALAERGCGTLEILVRGVDVDPDRLRLKLKLRGNASLALVITRIGTTAVAFLCGPRSAIHNRAANGT